MEQRSYVLLPLKAHCLGHIRTNISFNILPYIHRRCPDRKIVKSGITVNLRSGSPQGLCGVLRD